MVRRSYLVCSAQRAGSWLLCHALEDTAVEIVYEDLIEDVDRAARNVAGFLHVPWPAGLEHIRPRPQRQADHHTERLAGLFSRHGEA